ncbi:MAG: DUF5320 domain-containing protein [Bacillota bacterium]
MPRGDRTGPAGFGPMTGRGMGYCAGYPHPGFMAPTPPMGGGFGWGRGYRHMYHATGLPRWARGGYYPGYYPGAPTKEEEVETLRGYAEELRQEISEIEEEIERLETDENEEE